MMLEPWLAIRRTTNLGYVAHVGRSAGTVWLWLSMKKPIRCQSVGRVGQNWLTARGMGSMKEAGRARKM